MIPKYIKLAHWLYDQGKPIALTEAANYMGVSLSGVYHYIASIRKCADIFHIKINQISITRNKKEQYAIRVIAIRPYKLVRGRRPTLKDGLSDVKENKFVSMDDMWKVLVSKPWEYMRMTNIAS
ncbi:hypothetical protein [Aeromonas hydrophila]|uniref:hypothetical protein n=1 Tax=Aeromonas hydrophila TaxID=644 RepID=UPI001F602ECC|nr:hypothetical protein [Aeromonas hydrophila]UNU27981.1 hypothetical protein GCK65_01865 [Aeromonas hydrophila]